jgi:hypothetical protein
MTRFESSPGHYAPRPALGLTHSPRAMNIRFWSQWDHVKLFIFMKNVYRKWYLLHNCITFSYSNAPTVAAKGTTELSTQTAAFLMRRDIRLFHYGKL